MNIRSKLIIQINVSKKNRERERERERKKWYQIRGRIGRRRAEGFKREKGEGD